MTSDLVKFIEHGSANGRIVAEARLDSEPTLNALSLEMIDLMAPVLERWAEDDRVVAVILTGADSLAHLPM